MGEGCPNQYVPVLLETIPLKKKTNKTLNEINMHLTSIVPCIERWKQNASA